MNKAITILIISFFVFTLFPKGVFSLATPIEQAYWCNDFRSSRSFDASRSTVEWQNGTILLREREENIFSSAGVLWTWDIGFRQHVYSLTLSGVYDEPQGTQVRGFVNFDGEIQEYSLAWDAVYKPKDPHKKFRLKMFLATSNPEISPTINEICLRIELQDRSEAGIKNRNNTRVAELKRVQGIVQNYYNDFDKYPVVNIQKRDKERQWRLLRSILESASTTYRQNYTRRFVSQPVGVDDDYKYGYLTNNFGSHYLFWTKLEDIDSEHFEDSWQGEILGVNCAPPIYCLCSKKDRVEEPILQYFGPEQRISQIQGAEFVKRENDPRVWFQLNDYRFWLRTPTIFEKAGGLWDKINLKASLADIPLLKFVKKEDHPAVYLISAGLKRALPEERIFDLYGQASEIITLNDQVIDLLPENYLIRGAGQTKVYFLDQKIKRWITSPEVLEKMGFDWSEVVEVEPQEIDYYPEAAPIF